MQRRFVLIASLAVGLTFSGPSAYASEQIGVLMLHGKSPGHPQDPNFSPLKTRFEQEGWKVQLPDMPWSRSRYLEGNWDGAMGEIAAHVKTLRGQGATRVVLVGHSMGVPAALSHAARGGDAQALVLLAAGPTLAGFALYNRSLAELPSSVANLIVTLEPAFTTVMAYFLFQETFTPIQWTGSLLIACGVVFLRVYDTIQETRAARATARPAG